VGGDGIDVAEKGGAEGAGGVMHFAFAVHASSLIRPAGTFSRWKKREKASQLPSPAFCAGEGARRADEGHCARRLMEVLCLRN
jgi:hypothetical protein